MRAVLILLILGECLFANAQTLEQQIAAAYTPFFDLNERGFEIDTKAESQNPGKYTSYKVQYFNRAKGIWVNQDSVVVFYDGKENVSSKVTFGKTGKGWRKAGKLEVVLDASGKPEANIGYTWSVIESKWQCNSEKLYQIDTDKKLFAEQTKVWDRRANRWTYGNKNIYTYDKYSNDTLHISQRWDTAANSWIDERAELKTYDSFRHLRSEHQLYRSREESALKESWLSEYTRDSIGRELAHFYQNGKDYCREDSTFYDTLNRPVENRDYVWRSSEGRWVLFDRTKWTYEVASGQMKSARLQWVRVPHTDSIALGVQTFRTYNSANNMISQTIMRNYDTYTNPSGHGWFVDSYDSADYDDNNSISYLYREYWSGSNVLQVFFYDKAYDVGEGETNIEPETSAEMLYPNPSRGGKINLRVHEDANCGLLINIVDMDGKNIASETLQAFTGANSLPISHPGLSPATYFVEVINQSTGKKSSFKWVVE